MRRTRKAIDAAVLATAIGIDRTVEANVGRVVPRDHFSRCVQRNRGLERRQFLEALPAVVEGNARLGFITAAGVGLRAATAPPRALDCDRKLRKRSCTRRL